jgi:hypothetical protein
MEEKKKEEKEAGAGRWQAKRNRRAREGGNRAGGGKEGGEREGRAREGEEKGQRGRGLPVFVHEAREFIKRGRRSLHHLRGPLWELAKAGTALECLQGVVVEIVVERDDGILLDYFLCT